jgi:hypothetical protein
MDKQILNQICYFLPIPEKVLSSCKKFTIQRIYNIRWKNRVYYTDNRIKIINCKVFKKIIIPWIFTGIKKLWYKDGNIHRDDIDSTTGLVFPALIDDVDVKGWYKDGILHRDDIDPDTGRDLPSIVRKNFYEMMEWYIYGEYHCDNIDPETGFTLPAKIDEDEKRWFKKGMKHRDEIDPETGLTLPAKIYNNYISSWSINGKTHRVEIDPDTGRDLPAVIYDSGAKYWYKDGVEKNEYIFS